MASQISLMCSQYPATVYVPYPEPIQCSSHPNILFEIRYIIMQPSTSSSPNWTLSSDVTTKIVHALFTSTIHAKCSVHFILLGLITVTILGE